MRLGRPRLLPGHAENRPFEAPSKPADFGDADSYWLKVRRIGRNYPCGDDVRDGDFGIYLGLHDEGYLVALQAILPADIIGYERFHSLGDLKAHWELD